MYPNFTMALNKKEAICTKRLMTTFKDASTFIRGGNTPHHKKLPPRTAQLAAAVRNNGLRFRRAVSSLPTLRRANCQNFVYKKQLI